MRVSRPRRYQVVAEDLVVGDRVVMYEDFFVIDIRVVSGKDFDTRTTDLCIHFSDNTEKVFSRRVKVPVDKHQ